MRFTQAWHSFFDRSTPNVVLRLIVMLAGVAITSASVALTRATGLGTSPVSCFPATLSYLTPLTIGTWTFIMNVVFVLIQIALLRRDFNPVQLLQIPYVFVFSALIDAFVPLCELIPMGNYALQITWSVVGCFMTAFGVFLQVKASFLTLPGEGINLAISRVTKIAFPKVKVAFDCTNVVVAAAVSLACSGALYGVREGTILAALAVGSIVALFNKLLPRFERFCPTRGHITLTAATMPAPDESASPSSEEGDNTPLVITISRQFGSGGREIGQALGKSSASPFSTKHLSSSPRRRQASLPPTSANTSRKFAKECCTTSTCRTIRASVWNPASLTICGWPKPTQSQSSQIKEAALSLAAAQTRS